MLNLNELIEMNHWWKIGRVKREFALPYKRKLFKEILKYLNSRQIISIIGLRRVGKTVLLYQTIDHLIENGVDPKNILYFSFDERKTELRELFELYQEKIIKKKINNEKIFVFLDEIQKLENWQNKMKIFYDLYPNIKFFVSGSASLNIFLDAKETLAGRIFYFYLDLLSFEEFLELKHKNIENMRKNPELWKEEINIELNEYLLKPFPELIDMPDEVARKYIKEAIIERVILRDISCLFGIREIEAMEKVIYAISSNPGLLINLDDMSRNFAISRQVLSNYLYYLQYCFLIRQLKNFRGSLKVSSRKLKKYYPLHPCFTITLSSLTENGKIVESLVAFKTKAEYYWRERQKEVDFVLIGRELLPMEVKYKNNIRIKELRGLLKFMEKFKVKKSLVITKDYEAKEEFKGKTITFKPLWKWLLNL